MKNQIKIKSLTLLNFKGIRNLTIEQFGQQTDIYGANGTGKTTIFDAFTWLLFGKDSTDRQQFEIKTLDKFNNVIPKLDHEVSAVLDVNGEEIEIKRVMREKWVKPRGAVETEFAGNETTYFWNDVPVLAKEYAEKIANLVDEKVFKMITNPLAFNSLKWQDQRQVLMNIAGGVTNEEVAEGNSDFGQLLSKLTNKSLDDYKKQTAASLRKVKNEIKNIPHRIDEVERGKPERENFGKIEAAVKANEEELDKVEKMISNRLEAHQDMLNRKTELMTDINGIKTSINELKYQAQNKATELHRNQNQAAEELKKQISKKEQELQNANRALDQLNAVEKNEQQDIDSYTKKNNEIREQWTKVNAEEFQMDDEDCKCPTCKREFEADDIEAKKKELQENFNKNKQEKLNDLNTRGRRNKALIEKAQEEIETIHKKADENAQTIKQLLESIDADKAKLQELQSKTTETVEEIFNRLISESEIEDKKTEKAKLQGELENLEPIQMDDLKEQKEALKDGLSVLNKKLSNKEQIEKADKRIDQLKEEEQTLAQQIADYEKEQYVIDNFIKAKIDRLEEMINSKFKMVRFKMFETQVNGGEVETCKALIDGVPFSDANTASKINAGVDIINTLSEHYKVSAPIFIDNRESVIELIDSDSQIVNLIVSEEHKELTIEWEPEQELQTV